MIDWSTLQAGLASLVSRLTGIAAGDIAWAGAKDRFVAAPKLASIDLQTFANTTVGQLDALTWSEQSPNGPLQQTTQGWREFTLRIRVTTYDQRPVLVARTYLEMVRDRMAWDSTRDALAALSLGFVEALSLTDLSAPRDSRIASIASLDLRFNLASADTDPTLYERISTVEFDPTYS